MYNRSSIVSGEDIQFRTAIDFHVYLTTYQYWMKQNLLDIFDATNSRKSTEHMKAHILLNPDMSTLDQSWEGCLRAVLCGATLSEKKCYNDVDPPHTLSFWHFLDRRVVES